MKQAAHFVLVHGGGHGAWCWVKLIPLLENAGHKVTALDMVSAGENNHASADDIDFEQYNQPLVDFFKSLAEEEKVVLVGHSLGGLNLTAISEQFPSKVSVAIYLTAFMPPIGKDFVECITESPDLIPQLEWKANFKVEGGPPTSIELAPELLKSHFYNTCSDEDLQWAIKHVKPCPAIDERMRTPKCTAEKYGTVPRISVLCKLDKTITPKMAHKMIDMNPPNEVIEIDSDHSLFFSAKETTAKILVEAAAKYGV